MNDLTRYIIVPSLQTNRTNSSPLTIYEDYKTAEHVSFRALLKVKQIWTRKIAATERIFTW
jgi:hypothetical protein